MRAFRLLSRLLTLAALAAHAPACSSDDAAPAAPATPAVEAGTNTGASDGDGGTIADGSSSDGHVEPAHGFRADWFDVFSDRKLTRVEPAAAVAHDAATSPAPGVRGILYSVRWTATLTAASAGEHGFFATADDGVRLFVDDKPVIDDWSTHAAQESTGKVTLTAGEPRGRRTAAATGRRKSTRSPENTSRTTPR
jgi:hypothetical protein